jgi:hypothetical protein
MTSPPPRLLLSQRHQTLPFFKFDFYLRLAFFLPSAPPSLSSLLRPELSLISGLHHTSHAVRRSLFSGELKSIGYLVEDVPPLLLLLSGDINDEHN